MTSQVCGFAVSDSKSIHAACPQLGRLRQVSLFSRDSALWRHLSQSDVTVGWGGYVLERK